VGQLSIIRNGVPILNVGQDEDLHVKIYVLLWANLGLSEVGSLFKILANVKACMELFISNCGPTQAY
jgi:hypothetical protein